MLNGFIEKFYGLAGTFKKLPGDVDHNYYFCDSNNKEYLFKIYHEDTSVEQAEFEILLLTHLEHNKFPFNIPQIIHSRKGNITERVSAGNLIRLQKWVQGNLLSEVNPRTENILKKWGKIVGHLSKCLKGFSHPFAERNYMWDPLWTLESRKFLPYITEDYKNDCAVYFFRLLEEKDISNLDLRRSVNYSDAHEHNLLTNSDYPHPDITGLIDFGDAVESYTICELAIACAYAGMQMEDPIEAMSHLVGAYHKIFPIQEIELEYLYYLIIGRLLISVSHSARNAHEFPENEYHQVSAKAAWKLLLSLKEINPHFALYKFREVCGFCSCPYEREWREWISSNKDIFHEVIKLEGKIHSPLDLSISSTELGNNSEFNTIDAFTSKIRRILEDKASEIAYGGYMECRPVYEGEQYIREGNHGREWRTVHLGLDIWADSGVEVFTPLDGEIHSVIDDKGHLEYGPVIIMKYKISSNFEFYILYGHLSRESIKDKSPGSKFGRGDKIAELGSPEVNGGWPPHLHFQVILDMMGNTHDFPGVAYPGEAVVFQSICPNPSVFFPFNKYSPETLDKEGIIRKRNKYLGNNLSLSYNRPLNIVRGFKQYLYDQEGRRFLDTVNNVAHVGHQHPRVVNAARKQIGLLNTNTRYLNHHISSYAEELLACFPDELSVVYFVNSGSEATELALRMTEAHTGSNEIITLEHGYHGNTGGCISISSYKFDGKGGKGKPSRTHLMPVPDVYRGKYNDAMAGQKFAGHILPILEECGKGGKKIGAFYAESILSCAGQIVPPDGFLKEVYHHVRNAGGLCIADEVQIGFGRVGEKFWGFELQDVIPDIVTLGKPMGNGHPLAAVVCTQEVANAFANGMEYFNTFGGNPVSCAIGREVLQVIQDENLQENALRIGNYLKEELHSLMDEFPVIADVRGKGLFLGFEMVEDRDSKTPAGKKAGYVVNRMRERGILMSTDGPFNNVIKIKPPMCFSKGDADYLLYNLSVVLNENYL